jgi:hypothetical protein
MEKSEETREITNQTLTSFETEILKVLDKKANVYDVTTMLNSKADAVSTNLAIQSKVPISEFEHLKINFEKLNREYTNKLDFDKFDAYFNDIKTNIEETQKELNIKANTKEILNLLRNKAEIDDVNKALTQIHDELDQKTNLETVNYIFK